MNDENLEKTYEERLAAFLEELNDFVDRHADLLAKGDDGEEVTEEAGYIFHWSILTIWQSLESKDSVVSAFPKPGSSIYTQMGLLHEVLRDA